MLDDNEWICVGCIQVRTKRDFLAGGFRLVRNVEDGRKSQPVVCALCSRCKAREVWKTPNFVAANIERIVLEMPNLVSSTAVTTMLSKDLIYGGDFWASLNGGLSDEQFDRLQVFWEHLDGYTVLGPNCYASWIGD